MLALHLVNLFFSGMLAGIEITLHYGFRVPVEVLSEDSQLRLRRALVKRLRWFVPAFFVPSAVSAVALTAFDRMAPGASWRIAGILAVLVWVSIRVVGTVPINSATLVWNVDAPLKNWKALIDHAERFHILGVPGSSDVLHVFPGGARHSLWLGVDPLPRCRATRDC
jgi:hypothetical protein